MAVAWRSAGTFASGTGDVTPGLPTGWQADDIFILAIGGDESASITTPSGWTQVASSPQVTGSSTTGTTLGVFWRRATGSESAPLVTDTGDNTRAIIHAFSGCKTSGSPVNSESGSFDTGTGTSFWFSPAYDTTVDNCMIVMIGGMGVDTTTAQFSSFTNRGLDSAALRSDNHSTSGVGGGIIVYTGTKVNAGPQSNPSEVFFTTTSSRARMSIALEPQAANPLGIRVTPSVITSLSDNPPNEIDDKAADGDTSTKWLSFATTSWLRYQLSTSQVITKYTLTSANDDATRDPKNWDFQGSADGSAWTTIESRTGETFATRYLTKSYTTSNTTSYLYYRLNVTLNNGSASIIQLGDWLLYRDANASPAAEHVAATATSNAGKGSVGAKAQGIG